MEPTGIFAEIIDLDLSLHPVELDNPADGEKILFHKPSFDDL
jgi:hypothetical protein